MNNISVLMCCLDMPATKKKKDSERGKPFNFFLPPSLIDRIDDYRFRHRFPSRSAALAYIAVNGLETKPKRPVGKSMGENQDSAGGAVAV